METSSLKKYSSSVTQNVKRRLASLKYRQNLLGKKITLSSNHLIPINKINALKPARDIRVGDNIFVVTTAAAGKKSHVIDTVVDVDTVIAEGLYWPHTASGTLMVDGVLVSCYTTVLPVWVQHFLVTPLAWLYKWLPYRHSGAKSYHSIARPACRASSKYCGNSFSSLQIDRRYSNTLDS